MRILLIHNRYKEKGGEDFVVATEYELLQQNGHDVFLLEFDNKNIKSGVGTIKAGIQSFYNLSSARILKSTIKSLNPDIIHIHNIFYIVSPSVFHVANKYGIPVVMTLHNYRLICVGALLLRNNLVCEICINKTFPLSGVKYKCHRNSALESLQLVAMTGLHKLLGTWRQKVGRYIVLTEFGKNKMLNSSLGLKEDQVVVKANSVEDRGHESEKSRSPFYLFIGRLSEEKGIQVLLESISHFQYPLTVIGDGPFKELVIEYSKKYDCINYLGFQDKSSIIKSLKACKALIFPSTWYEGMPLTLLESFSTGTPVICSDMENLNKIVKDQYNGLLFNAGSAKSLASTIQSFNKYPNKKYYENARQTYDDYYTEKINYNNLMNVYQGLIAK
jgi:glycosyltransferase involved in cell wall biosynthesis